MEISKVFHFDQLYIHQSDSSVFELTPCELDAVPQGRHRSSIKTVELDERFVDEELARTSNCIEGNNINSRIDR